MNLFLDRHVVSIAGIIVLGVLEITAMLTGHNGQYLANTMLAIAAIAGGNELYKLMKARKQQ